MQPAPYEQVADAVSRALDNVKEEWAALELQSRGAVFDDQKKEIVETMLRGFLLGNARRTFMNQQIAHRNFGVAQV